MARIRTHSHKKNGFADYNDLATASTPITLVLDTWTPLTNDGLGVNTNLDFLPTGVTNLMDTSTGEIDASELQLGDVLVIRNDFTITPGTNNQTVDMRYTAGLAGGAYTLETNFGRMDSGSGQPYRFTLRADMIYMGDPNTRDNPIGIEIKTSGGGTVVNSGSSIAVIRY